MQTSTKWLGQRRVLKCQKATHTPTYYTKHPLFPSLPQKSNLLKHYLKKTLFNIQSVTC